MNSDLPKAQGGGGTVLRPTAGSGEGFLHFSHTPCRVLIALIFLPDFKLSGSIFKLSLIYLVLVAPGARKPQRTTARETSRAHIGHQRASNARRSLQVQPRETRHSVHAMRRCTHTYIVRYMLHLTISLIQLDTCHVRKSTHTPAHRTAWRGHDAQSVQTVR